MPALVGLIIGLVLGVGGTVCLYIFVLPEKKRAGLPGFFKVLHDFFNMKFLVIEKILKFIYILNTVVCISVGVFMLMSMVYVRFGSTRISTGYSMAPLGLILIFVGPVVCRLIHEGVMMMILLVKNTMEINQKLKKQEDAVCENGTLSAFDLPSFDLKRAPKPAAPAPGYPYPGQPAQPGNPYPPQPGQPGYGAPNFNSAAPGETVVMGPKKKVCKVCGNPLNDNDRFCLNCGTRVEE